MCRLSLRSQGRAIGNVYRTAARVEVAIVGFEEELDHRVHRRSRPPCRFPLRQFKGEQGRCMVLAANRVALSVAAAWGAASRGLSPPQGHFLTEPSEVRRRGPNRQTRGRRSCRHGSSARRASSGAVMGPPVNTATMATTPGIRLGEYSRFPALVSNHIGRRLDLLSAGRLVRWR